MKPRFSTHRQPAWLSGVGAALLLTGILAPLGAQSLPTSPPIPLLTASLREWRQRPQFLRNASPKTGCLASSTPLPGSSQTGRGNPDAAAATTAGTQAAIAQLKQRGLYTSLSEAMQRAFYSVERDHKGSLVADNPAQKYSVTFATNAVQVQPFAQKAAQTAPGSLAARRHSRCVPAVAPAATAPARVPAPLAMSLHSIGYGNQPQGVAPAAPRQAGNKVEYRHAGVTEWYENKAEGLEQGFTLAKRLPGATNDTPLRLAIVVSGNVLPRLSPDRQSVQLGSGLTYKDLVVKDSAGKTVPAQLGVAGHSITLAVQDSKARYPLVIDPILAETGTKLTASDAATSDNFGNSVAVSGDTALVGAYNKGAGAAYVFTRTGITWTQQQKLTASDGVAGDRFGWFVAINGDTVVVGANARNSATGAAYVFTRNGTAWTQQQILTASDGAASDQFGISVSVGDDTAVVGAYNKNSGSGEAYVFTRANGTWTQQKILTTSDGATNTRFGYSVALSGDTVVAGAYNKNTARGAAYVFTRANGTWPVQQILTASNAANSDQFGFSVALNGDTAVIGAPSKSTSRGAAYVFTRANGTWTQQQLLTADVQTNNDKFGYSVSLSGDTAVAGAWGKNTNMGLAYVFTRTGTAWTQQQKLTAGDGIAGDQFGYAVAVGDDTVVAGAISNNSSTGGAYVYRIGPKLTASDGLNGDNFGYSVAVSGDTALVGAYGKSSAAGVAYVFTRSGTTWTQQQKLILSVGTNNDFFGYSVALSGDTALVGAYGKSSATGAAYVFTRSGTTWTQQQKLTASDGLNGDNFGYSVALSGDTALIGAYGKNSQAGVAYVFTRSDTTWTQQQILTSLDAATGDRFGYSVAVSGDTAVAGTPYKSSQAGAAYVFTRSGTAWTQQQKLTASDAAANDFFGNSVAVSGDTALVGAYFKNNKGAAYVYGRSPIGVADQYTIPAGTTYTASNLTGLLSNDDDPDALLLTSLLFRAPQYGMLTLNSDGSFTYTPDANSTATSDTFLYLTRNSVGGISDPVPVTLVLSAQNVNASMQITRGGYARASGAGNYTQKVTLTNTGSASLSGPLSLVLDGLPAGVIVTNTDGMTSTANVPAGSPYVNVAGPLAPGASISLTLRFADPTNVAITYTARALAGAGAR